MIIGSRVLVLESSPPILSSLGRHNSAMPRLISGWSAGLYFKCFQALLLKTSNPRTPQAWGVRRTKVINI